MNRNSLVSVIIPVYNVRPYLAEALDSVLYQTYGDLEIIIIDDGSTDGSGEVCAAYAEKDARIRLIHTENRGLSAARNKGLDCMTGEAVAFLDPDDAFQPDYIRIMRESMIRENADVVLCKYAFHYETGNMRQTGREKICPSIKEGGYGRDDALRALVENKLGHTVWNKLYSSDLWCTVRYPEGHVYEDIDTTYRILDLCHKVYVVDLPLYLKRQHRESITATWPKEHVQDWMQSRSHLESYVQAHTPGIFTSEHEQILRYTRLRALIRSYIHYSRENGESGKEFCDELKRQIMEIGREVDLRNIKGRYRICYRLICFHPRMVKPASAVFLLVKRLLKLTG